MVQGCAGDCRDKIKDLGTRAQRQDAENLGFNG